MLRWDNKESPAKKSINGKKEIDSIRLVWLNGEAKKSCSKLRNKISTATIIIPKDNQNENKFELMEGQKPTNLNKGSR